MKLNIRYLGLVITDYELNESSKKEIFIGRSDDCDIRLTKDFISRKHGKIFLEDGKWFYQDLRSDHPHYHAAPQEITHESPISLEKDTDLTTNQYLNSSTTKIIQLDQLKKKSSSSKIIIPSLAAAVVLVAIGLYTQKMFMPLNSSELLAHVEKRFVEFEMKKDSSLEKEFIAKGLLKEEDFKDQVGFCSGFIIKPGIVMTASHCLLGADAISPMIHFELKTYDNKKHKIDRVVGMDLSRDIIVVEVPSLKDYDYFDIKVDHEIGEPVYTVGNVHGEGMAIRDGTISSITKDPNNPEIDYLRYTAATSPGNSGGPLVDAYGNVVGLVFARSNAAENYNLSAPYSALNTFVKRFLPIKDNIEVEFNTDKLIFGAYLGSQYSNYGFLNRALNSNNDFYDPEIQEELNKIKFSLTLPMEYKSFKTQVQVRAQEQMHKKIEEAVASLEEKGKIGNSWITHVNDKHPVLVPRDLDDSLLTFDQLTSDYLWEKNILVLEPANFYEKSVSDHSYFTNTWDNVFPKDFNLKNRSVFPQYLRTFMSRFSSIFNSETSLVLLDYSADEPQQIDEDKYKQALKFENDFVISPYGITYPFIRPKKLKEFKISNFEFEKDGEIKDRYNRVWRRSKVVLFRDIHLHRYCTSYPQAQLCINKPFNSSENESLDLIEKNYAFYHLSEKILDLNFWSLDALDKYLKEDSSSYEFSDVELTKVESSYKLHYKYFDLNYKITKAKQLKLLPAVIKNKDGEAQWVTIGHQAYYPAQGDKKPFICRSEIDFPKLKTSYLASYYHRSKKQNKKLSQNQNNDQQRNIAATSVVDKIKVSEFKTDKWEQPLKLYQTCREVLKNDYSEGYFMGEFRLPPKDMF